MQLPNVLSQSALFAKFVNAFTNSTFSVSLHKNAHTEEVQQRLIGFAYIDLEMILIATSNEALC